MKSKAFRLAFVVPSGVGIVGVGNEGESILIGISPVGVIAEVATTGVGGTSGEGTISRADGVVEGDKVEGPISVTGVGSMGVGTGPT